MEFLTSGLTIAAIPGWLLAVIGVIGLAVLVVIIFMLNFLGLYIQAQSAGARIGFRDLIGMWFRKVNMVVIVRSKIMVVQAQLDVPLKELEAHFLAGGNVPAVVRAYIAADRAGLDLNFKTACGIDLAGRDVIDAVQTFVNPKVIDCPIKSHGKTTVDAVAKDGIQVKAKARVTVRTNLAQLIGGATQETIVARVGEGVVTCIGSADTYKSVLENPDNISKLVLGKGLDAGTAYEILSIDIADVDVGDNIGAQLQANQAEADKRVAQARAEVRRAMAVAQEQEMKAKVVENRAKVVEAEAEVPRAMADAFRSGRLGIMDYYRMKNIVSDTDMRTSIAKGDEHNKKPSDGLDE